VLLDAHYPSPLDTLWGALYSAAPIIRPHDLHNNTLVAVRAIFPIAGYASIFLADLEKTGVLKRRLALFSVFRLFVLSSVGVPSSPTTPATNTQLVLISRRPATEDGRLDRQLANEPEILSHIETRHPDLHAAAVDLARLTVREQVALMGLVDILVGVHGAGLTHVVFLGKHAALIEIWPQGGKWRCFEHLAAWSGVYYQRVRNTCAQCVYFGRTGWALKLPPEKLDWAVDAALEHVTGRGNLG